MTMQNQKSNFAERWYYANLTKAITVFATESFSLCKKLCTDSDGDTAKSMYIHFYRKGGSFFMGKGTIFNEKGKRKYESNNNTFFCN